MFCLTAAVLSRFYGVEQYKFLTFDTPGIAEFNVVSVSSNFRFLVK